MATPLISFIDLPMSFNTPLTAAPPTASAAAAPAFTAKTGPLINLTAAAVSQSVYSGSDAYSQLASATDNVAGSDEQLFANGVEMAATDELDNLRKMVDAFRAMHPKFQKECGEYVAKVKNAENVLERIRAVNIGPRSMPRRKPTPLEYAEYVRFACDSNYCEINRDVIAPLKKMSATSVAFAPRVPVTDPANSFGRDDDLDATLAASAADAARLAQDDADLEVAIARSVATRAQEEAAFAASAAPGLSTMDVLTHALPPPVLSASTRQYPGRAAGHSLPPPPSFSPTVSAAAPSAASVALLSSTLPTAPIVPTAPVRQLSAAGRPLPPTTAVRSTLPAQVAASTAQSRTVSNTGPRAPARRQPPPDSARRQTPAVDVAPAEVTREVSRTVERTSRSASGTLTVERTKTRARREVPKPPPAVDPFIEFQKQCDREDRRMYNRDDPNRTANGSLIFNY